MSIDTKNRIQFTCEHLMHLLWDKNDRYGDSALSPIRVFSTASAEEGIRVRIDDKISRIMVGAADDDEDPILDLAGYLILLLVERDRNKEKSK